MFSHVRVSDRVIRNQTNPAEASTASSIEIRERSRVGPPGVVRGLGGDDLLMDQAPEHALNVAFHRGEERVLGEVVDQRSSA